MVPISEFQLKLLNNKMIIVSTSFLPVKDNFKNLQKFLLRNNYDGLEFSSLHSEDFDYNLFNNFKKKIFIHNFFPPLKDRSFIINISSEEKRIRENSIEFIKSSISFSKKINAILYTFHPGFNQEVKNEQKNVNIKNFDFKFENTSQVNRENKILLQEQSIKSILDYAKSVDQDIAIETDGSLSSPESVLLGSDLMYRKLFKKFDNLKINLNLAHTYFASKYFKFNLENFIDEFYENIAAVELSCNNGLLDQHLPLTKDCYLLKYVKKLKKKPIILEFRECEFSSIDSSIDLIKNL